VTAAKFAYGWRIPFTRIPVGSLEVPSRGDIVVFTRTPAEDQDAFWTHLDIAGLVPSSDYIKRVVALPGDTVAVVDGELVLNGELRRAREEGPYRYVDHACEAMQTRRYSARVDDMEHVILKASHARNRRSDWGPKEVPKGHVFMLGDNRDRSKDSRSVGFVPIRDIKAKASRIWASLPLCTRGNALPEVRWNRVGKALH
jgi:signal peptidase I